LEHQHVAPAAFRSPLLRHDDIVERAVELGRATEQVDHQSIRRAAAPPREDSGHRHRRQRFECAHLLNASQHSDRHRHADDAAAQRDEQLEREKEELERPKQPALPIDAKETGWEHLVDCTAEKPPDEAVRRA